MLNGRYIIIGGEYSPVVNPYAYGNCWFVDNYVPAATPDDEIALLASTDLHDTAVIGDDFGWAQRFFADAQNDNSEESSDRIELTHYAPNELRYTFSTGTDRAAIFSEIYYPKGWKAWIEPEGVSGEVRNGHYHPSADGHPIDFFRADWMLRGAIIPQGDGQLIMRFEPDSYQIGENISRTSSIVLIILLLGSAIGAILSARRKN